MDVQAVTRSAEQLSALLHQVIEMQMDQIERVNRLAVEASLEAEQRATEDRLLDLYA